MQPDNQLLANFLHLGVAMAADERFKGKSKEVIDTITAFPEHFLPQVREGKITVLPELLDVVSGKAPSAPKWIQRQPLQQNSNP